MRNLSQAGVALAVALVLLSTGCGWARRLAYSGFGRDGWQQPQRVVESLDLRAGQHVADLGAGGGYFTFDLADAVTPEGTVYAVDVDPDMADYLRDRAAESGYPNVQVVLAEYDDPLLPAGQVDLIFTCNTYHHFQDRAAYFERAGRALRPDGRVAIIEFSGKGWFARWFGHFTPSEEMPPGLGGSLPRA